MPAVSASASGKIILLGEHAVVYGKPALAVPVQQVQTRVVITPLPTAPPGALHIQAPEVHLNAALDSLPPDHPLRIAVQAASDALNGARFPAAHIKITSTIPVAAGLGSGAAMAVALIHALARFVGRELPPAELSAAAYRVEQRLHGTPSGIDNTVIAYAQPVGYQRGRPFDVLRPCAPFTLVIADTGIHAPTQTVVGDLRRRWQDDPASYEVRFEAIGGLVEQARRCIEHGPLDDLGGLLDANHALLQELDISCPELDALVQTARAAGALGAKLSGGGRGGNMLALCSPQSAPPIAAALQSAGAVRVIQTTVEPPRD